MNTFKFPAPLREALWKHQKDCIRFAYERLRNPNFKRTALARLPTGTGKTGIIAVLAVAIRPPHWTLVLTPWKNLRRQMIGDLGSRFWSSIGWQPERKPLLQELFPSNVSEVLEEKRDDVVLISTFASLVTIFKKYPVQFDKLSQRLSEIFVDEGHYEPAVEWGRAVKKLKKPTLLLTATPYRNDLKLFQVKFGDNFNFTHRDAVARGIIRDVQFREMAASEARSGSLNAWCDEFYSLWTSAVSKELPKDARAIVCCSTMATVREVTRSLRQRGLDAIGIHERFANSQSPWLVRDTPNPINEEARIWVHQFKLAEGLDDNRFRVLAVLNRISNDRRLIQQIGRIVRKRGQRQTVFGVFLERSDDQVLVD